MLASASPASASSLFVLKVPILRLQIDLVTQRATVLGSGLITETPFLRPGPSAPAIPEMSKLDIQ